MCWSLIKEIEQSFAKPLRLPMDPRLKLTPDQGCSFTHGDKYRRLARKLMYLTITRPDISYAVLVLSQFMTKPTLRQMKAAINLVMCLKMNKIKEFLWLIVQ